MSKNAQKKVHNFVSGILPKLEEQQNAANIEVDDMGIIPNYQKQYIALPFNNSNGEKAKAAAERHRFEQLDYEGIRAPPSTPFTNPSPAVQSPSKMMSAMNVGALGLGKSTLEALAPAGTTATAQSSVGMGLGFSAEEYPQNNSNNDDLLVAIRRSQKQQPQQQQKGKRKSRRNRRRTLRRRTHRRN
jgi:hypothetical protein